MAKQTHDQKRKKKLEERRRRELARQPESLAYLGGKYQTDELMPTWMQAEIGIYEAYIMTDRKICDQTVVNAVERLIRQMRSGDLPPLPASDVIDYERGNEEALLIENIRRKWAAHFATEWKPPKDDLIGVLRTILGSIEKVRDFGPQSKAYMRHISDFLTNEIGVSMKRVPGPHLALSEPDGD